MAPRDLRGYVQDDVFVSSNPRLLKFSKSQLKSDPVFFSPPDRDRLLESLLAAAAEFNYRLTHIAIESWHLHWTIAHGHDQVDAMVGRSNTRMRQSSARCRIWTEGYWSQELLDDAYSKKSAARSPTTPAAA